MSIFDTFKSIIKVLQDAGKIELVQQILEIQQELLDMQKKISDLESKNKECEEKLRIKENLIYENNAYWINKENKKDGPFCSRCWDKDMRLIRLHTCPNPTARICPACKTIVNIEPENYTPPMISEGNLGLY
jgi:endogenous inhibitor of DNA gyrase (YacG/DUF329 family)